MRLRILLALALYCSIHSALCQIPASYTPVVSDSLSLERIKQTALAKYLADSSNLSGENKKYILEVFRSRISDIKQLFAEKNFYFTSDANAYLNSLTDKIIKANPVLNALRPRFLFSKDYWPNAYSMGEGTVVFNIGLFSKLKTESQIIFVLCHEISHLYLDHSNNAIRQYVNTVYSDDFQEKLKDLKKQKYEKNKELDKLQRSLAFTGRRHSRYHESEADSMAVILMRNTEFDLKESLTALAALDSIDKDDFKTAEQLPVLFNFPSFKFRNGWLKKENAFFGVSSEDDLRTKDEDSLKTHPDCKQRILKLIPLVTAMDKGTGQVNLVAFSVFRALQNSFEYETIAYCFSTDRVSRALYLSLALHQKDPANAYPVAMIGKCLNAMYDNQQAHTLGKITDLPSPYRDKNYNTLLEFIQNISLADIAAISYHFLLQSQAVYGTDKDFTTALDRATKNYNAH